MGFQFPRKPRPSKRWRYIMALPDLHNGYVMDTPIYCITAWDIAMQALRHYAKRLTDLVFLGDFGSYESMSHWMTLRADQAFIEEDIELVRARLDEVEAITKPNGISVWFIEGNHEAWCGQFEAKYPTMRDAVNLPLRLGFKERGWTWVPENHFLQIGDAHFTHGHLRGASKVGDIARRKGVSVIKAHDHTYATASIRTLHGELAEWSFGCLASIDPPPPYARGVPPDRWVHGFGFVQVRSNGLFQVSYRRIIDEIWTELEDGTELRADTQACRSRYTQDMRIREALRKRYADRFYLPGGVVDGGSLPEPHHGEVGKDKTATAVARSRRARIVRTLPDTVKGANK